MTHGPHRPVEAANPPLVTVVDQLVHDFPEVGASTVVAAVQTGRTSVALLGMQDEPDHMTLIEKVARQELDLLTGRVDDTARLLGTRTRPRTSHRRGSLPSG